MSHRHCLLAIALAGGMLAFQNADAQSAPPPPPPPPPAMTLSQSLGAWIDMSMAVIRNIGG